MFAKNATSSQFAECLSRVVLYKVSESVVEDAAEEVVTNTEVVTRSGTTSPEVVTRSGQKWSPEVVTEVVTRSGHHKCHQKWSPEVVGHQKWSPEVQNACDISSSGE